MTKTKTKAALTVLAVIGILAAAPALWGYLNGCPHFTRRLLLSILSRQSAPPTGVEFRRVASGHGQGPRNSDFETFEFRSTDCVQIWSSYSTFTSSSNAVQEMENWINRANTVISPKVEASNEGGQSIERAVILNKNKQYAVLRRVGNKLHSIESSSLAHLLEFEKRQHFELENP